MCHMTHSYAWHNSFMRVTWSIHMRDTMHSYVRHTSFICATWLSTFLGAFECATLSFTRATCLILTRPYKFNTEFTNFVRAHPWDLRFACSCVLHGSSMSVTWRIQVYDTTIVRTWLTPCARTDRLSHSCHAPYSHHHSECVKYIQKSCQTYELVLSHVWMCHAIHMNESPDPNHTFAPHSIFIYVSICIYIYICICIYTCIYVYI